jgi:purine nucleosidase
MIKKVKKRHVTIELGGVHTRGQMVIDHINKNETNAFVIEQIDSELFKKFMLWVCEHESEFEF